MSWPTIPLGDAVTFKGGGTPSRRKAEYWGGAIPWATVKDFVSGNILGSTQESITEAGLHGSATNVVPAGTVIMPTRMALGKAAIAEVDMAINQDLKALIPTSDIEPRYLLWFLLANSTRIAAMGKGATVKGVTLDQLGSLAIPLPRPSEQRRIAAILDKADTLRAKRREAITKLDQLLQSVFVDIFGDPATNPKGWRISTIGEECHVGSGSTPSRKNKANFEGSIPWVRSTDVRWGKIVTTDEHVSLEAQKAARLRLYPIGTIIVALYGQGKTRGKCAVLGMPATINQACAAISPSHNVDPMFLFHYLRLSYSRLRAESRGGNQENLNLGILKSFPLIVPPFALQKRFAAYVEASSVQNDALHVGATALDSLFDSIQQRSFSNGL